METKKTASGRIRFAPKTVRECIDREIRAERRKKKKTMNEFEACEHMAAQCALQRVRVALFGESLPPEENGGPDGTAA